MNSLKKVLVLQNSTKLWAIVSLNQRNDYSVEAASHRWHRRQNKDPYVRMARDHEYRARSAFKLLEIDGKFKLLHPGTVALELGAAPGAWTQVLVDKTNANLTVPGTKQGFVVGVDRLPISPVRGAHLLGQSDVCELKTQEKIQCLLGVRPLDIVLSDMAPNAIGQSSTDHDRIIRLCRVALRLAIAGDIVSLKLGGNFLCKLWDGPFRRQLVQDVQKYFSAVNICKPPASRDDSAEVYLVARDFRGVQQTTVTP